MEPWAGAFVEGTAEYSSEFPGEKLAAGGREGGVAPPRAGGKAPRGGLQGDGGMLFQAPS